MVFWGEPLLDEYGDGKSPSYVLVGEQAVVSFDLEGGRCTGAWMIHEEREP